MALEHVPVLFELVFVVGDSLGRGIAGLVFQGNDFHPEAEAADIYVGALIFAIGPSLLQPRARIDRQSNIGYIGALTYVDAADRSVDIDLLVFPVLLLSSRSRCRRAGAS